MIQQNESYSYIYKTLSELGMLETEDHFVQRHRENINEYFYFTKELSYSQINGILYNAPHFSIETDKIQYCEFWFGNQYINPNTITWIEDSYISYGILDSPYDISTITTISIQYNPFIIYRDGFYHPGTNNGFLKEIDTRVFPYNNLIYPDKSAFYISKNIIHIPKVTWINDYIIRFESTELNSDIDFVICSNLVNILNTSKNASCYIDNLYSNKCYYHIVINQDPIYPIDTRFYPCIKVNKDCIIRVYDTNYKHIENPVTSRLLNYSEFISITTPYNTTNAYLNSLTTCTDKIESDDSIETQLEKFKNISAYCYRVWEDFPVDTTYAKDFNICDNSDNEYFKINDIHTETEIIHKIYSTIPYYELKDILIYQGKIFHDYTTLNISSTDGIIVENNFSGYTAYIIDDSYNVQDFTLIKFNTDSDTVITNINSFISSDYYVNLHNVINTFYRNLIIVQQTILELQDNDKAYVSEEEPPHDNYTWFKLLTTPVFGDQPASSNISEIPNSVKTAISNISDDEPTTTYTQSLNIFNNTVNDIVAGDAQLNTIYYGETAPVSAVNNDIWFKYLTTMTGNVCYNDENTMVIALNEKLYLLQFDSDYVTAYAFDDILLKFNDKSYIKYLTVLIDLLETNVISLSDINIFYNRLLTSRDTFDPRLKRLYTNMPYIISTIDVSDPYFILYSKNIGKFHIDYASDTITRTEQESLYTMCIDFSQYDFTFIKDKMMLFINGEYIQKSNIDYISPNKIHVTTPMVISTVDILYSIIDDDLYKIKSACSIHWQENQTFTIPEDINNYKSLVPITIQQYTKRGFYDVLINDYILSGKLYDMIVYYYDHPDNFNNFRDALVSSFHTISDTDACHMDLADAKIIINGSNNNTDTLYDIKEI